jgi:O-antigen ligase
MFYYYQESPLFERLRQILESESAPLLLFLLAAALGLMALAIFFRAYRIVLMALLIGQMFSAIGGAGQGIFTLTRFGAIFALALIGFPGVTAFGPGQLMMLAYAVYVLLLTGHSEFPMWSLQFSGAFLFLVVGVAGATTRYVTDIRKLQNALGVVVLAALIWTAVNAVAGQSSEIRSTGMGRYAGVFGGTGSMAGIGGLLPPFLLWGFLCPWRRIYRYASLAGLVVLLPMLVLVGQRIGLFAAIVGLAPLVWFRLTVKRLLGSVFALAMAGVLSAVIVSAAPRQTQEFLLNKYIHRVGYLSGRDVRWQTMLAICMQDPILGHGAGTGDAQATVRFGSATHNAYISMFYDSGVIALGLWVGTALYAILRSFAFVVGRAPPETREIARLLLGCLLALSSEAFFESGLNSPTNLNAGLFLLCVTMVECIVKLHRRAAEGIEGYGWVGAPQSGYAPRPLAAR